MSPQIIKHFAHSGFLDKWLFLLDNCYGCLTGDTHHMETRLTTEYLNSISGFKTGQRYVTVASG